MFRPIDPFPARQRRAPNPPPCHHSSTHPATTTVTFERAGSVIIFRGVPAQLCDNCEEPYVDDTIAKQLLARAEAEAERGVEVAVVRFAA